MKHSPAALCAVVIFFAGMANAADRPPNVVLILADDVGCEPLGCYGGESYKTPHLDRLAETGMRFRHCYAMPVCHPTRTTLLTGRYPFRLNHPKWGTFPKAEEQHTLAHLMKAAGYQTAVAGKWQLTLLKNDPDHPRRMGFDPSCLFGWHEGPRYYQPLIWQNGAIRQGLEDRYGPDVYVEFLADFMKANQDRPFFAFYSMALCHNVTDDLKEPVPYGPEGHYDTYAQMIESMDRHVGSLVAAIDRLGLRERTVILFTGDNGTSKSYIHAAQDGKYIDRPVASKVNGEMVRGGKGELTNAGTNVPLIANWKGTIAPGQVVDDLVDMSDFLPTLVELAGSQVPNQPRIDGVSFAGRLLGKNTPGRRWAFSEQQGKSWVRTARYKLYDDGRLFDVANDVKEKKPIAQGGESAQATRKELSEAIKSLQQVPRR